MQRWKAEPNVKREEPGRNVPPSSDIMRLNPVGFTVLLWDHTPKKRGKFKVLECTTRGVFAQRGREKRKLKQSRGTSPNKESQPQRGQMGDSMPRRAGNNISLSAPHKKRHGTVIDMSSSCQQFRL